MAAMAAAALLCAAGAGPAAAAACAPEVVVRTLPLEVAQNHTLDVRAVTALNRRSSLPLTQRSVGLGSTYAESRVSAHWTQGPEGCPALALEVGYQGVTVHVARELAADRCTFEHVHAHEMTHVDIYRRWLAQEAPQRLHALLSERFDTLAALPPRERTAQTLQLALREFEQVRQRHDAFDSAEEYARNEQVCAGFVPRLLQRLRQQGRLP